jgi:DNA-binding XRE family transcriptional regulator
VKNEDCLIKFGLHLKELRKKHNISQQHLADISDIGKRTIQRIEDGQINPSLDIVCSIAFGLGMTLKELFDFHYEDREE